MEKPNSLPPEKDLPEHLYHYTSIDGLEGILTRRFLWASEIHFLNDTQEFKYSIDVLRKVISELRKKNPIKSIQKALGPGLLPSEQKEFLEAFYQSIEGDILFKIFVRFPIYIFSLSERGDLLSQWRGYCPPGGGYSIGFPLKLLTKFLETRDLFLMRCIYNEKEQEAMVKRAIIETVEISQEIFTKNFTTTRKDIKKAPSLCVLNFLKGFLNIASILKHPSFHEECEWRIISSNLIPIQDMSFRVGKSMLIPYFSISFKDIEPFLIDEIIIGPTTEQGLAENSLRQFVLQINPNISIKTSKTPYRQL